MGSLQAVQQEVVQLGVTLFTARKALCKASDILADHEGLCWIWDMAIFWSGQVPEVTGARARALHAAGMATPEELAQSTEDQIVRALAAGLPRAMRSSVSGAAKAFATGATGNQATNALVRRTAKLVLAGGGRSMCLLLEVCVDVLHCL